MKWLILLLFAPLAAHADYLFVNLNDGEDEIKYAQKALNSINKEHKRRGEELEELIVFPPILTKKERAELKAIDKKHTALVAQIKIDCVDKTSSGCKKSTEAKQAVEDQRQIYWGKKNYSDEGFKAVLDAQEKKGKTFRSVILSGHDGTGVIAGVNGSLSDKHFGEILSSYPNLSKNLFTLYVWGCYTANPGAIENMWKKNFPSVVAVFGYDYKGAKKDAKAGWTYLQGMMERELKALQVNDAKELQKLLKGVEGANIVKAAISVCDMYATPQLATTFEEMKKNCQKDIIDLEVQHLIFQCFARTETEKCLNPPADTSHSPLRDYYEKLQGAQICTQIPEYTDEFRSMSKDQAIRLIFYRNVVANLEHSYRKELKEVDSALKDLGAPEALRFSEISQLSRGDLFRRVEMLNDFLSAQEINESSNAIQKAQITMLFNARSLLLKSAVNLQSCVPFNWVEENAPEESTCGDKKYLGDAYVQTLLKDNSQLSTFSKSAKFSILNARLESAHVEAILNPTALNKAKYEQLQATVAWQSALSYPPSGGSITSEYKDPKVLKLRLDRANYLLKLAERGGDDIFSDAQLLRLTLEYNLASLKNTRSTSKPEIEIQIKLIESRMQNMGSANDPKILALQEQANEALFQAKLKSLQRQVNLLTSQIESSETDFQKHQSALQLEKEKVQLIRQIEIMTQYRERYQKDLYKDLFTRPVDGII